MRQHCWCNMRDAKKGTMVDPELADHMRNGIPLCAASCAAAYDRQQELRERATAGHINGHRHGGLAHI